ncbi:MAG: CsbD family protein [Sphingomonas sp.]|uniref:CsbD family protein n=1 Tax=Sphingomonas sp. TaxID=28214 RepID=UPI001AC2DF9F|nr:CsbD family protein [Sphingomonas sp.]MBN8814448.1 CsbD family protein [Sphingomonas sp.]
MGELTDKIKGAVDETIGKAKQVIGGHNGDAELHQEGLIQEGKGKGEKLVGEVKGALGDDI